MTKAILIVVSEGFGGYGDFLFALKLSQHLKKQYIDAGHEVPPVYIITQNTGQEMIQQLRGHIEFDVEILTPKELQKRVETTDITRKIDVGALIEGPVFHSGLMLTVALALKTLPTAIPLIMLPEYSSQGELLAAQNYRRESLDFKQIKYKNTICSGFNHRANEGGILLSDTLITPAPPEELVSQLDGKIRKALIGTKNIRHYQTTTELSFQYSHDHKYSDDKKFTVDTASQHFLNIHREFAKKKGKNQDVLMVGKNINLKHSALVMIKDKLIADGFTLISFYNTDNLFTEIIYDAKTQGREYKVIYTSSMSHQSMIASLALSGPLVGVTGDQSFGEAVSGDKIIVYECLRHKKPLIDGYDTALIDTSGNDDVIQKTLSLLRTANNDESYQRLGVLLREPTTHAKIVTSNRALLASCNLPAKIAYEGLGLEIKPKHVKGIAPDEDPDEEEKPGFSC